jgi:large subunit ribosomal protein L32e
MAEEEEPAPPAKEEGPSPPPPARRSRAARTRRARTPEPAPTPAPEESAQPTSKVPKRADLPGPLRTLLALRGTLDRRRPRFVRQQSYRYARVGRDGSWRRPRGLQSKQRRHYGYRSEVVRIGYRSPARVRGLHPSGFAIVLVQNRGDLEGLDGGRQAAVIGRTVGTRRRLALEEEARRLGIRVLNPIVKSEGEE